MTNLVDLEAMAGLVRPGAKLALPADYAGVSMALTRPLIERGPGDLHVVCVPTGGLQVDMLIGAGLVATLETSAMSLGEAGGAPCFGRAIADRSIRMVDATCPAVHAGLIAAQKGVPFLPIRGLIGTDVLSHRPDWKVIQNPVAEEEDPIVVVPAIVPDVAVFHAPMADRLGNVWIGRRRELATMAYAARRTLVTVERIEEESLLRNETLAAGVLPSLYIDALALAPRGAAPYGLWGEYQADGQEIARYAAAARTEAGFRDYMRLPARRMEAVQ